jgi:hypothetical protein
VNNCGKYPKQTETASSGIEYTTKRKKERHKIFLPLSSGALETTYIASTNKIIHKETKTLPHCKQAEHTDTSNSASVIGYIQKKHSHRGTIYFKKHEPRYERPTSAEKSNM